MKKLLTLLLVAFTSCAFAQKVKLVEGDLSALKGQAAITTEFVYENMKVGKDLTEQDYIKEKKGKLDEKEAGRGDKWEQAWYADRKDRFEPQFRELFAKHSGISTVGENAAYKLIFKTTRTEPGWNVGVMRVPAFIDGEAWIVDAKDPNKVIAKVTIMKSPGRDAWGMDFETGARLQEAYAKAGKELGGFIKSKTKK
ncbi:MAG: hypothetical protein ACOYXT_18030 [Bacteroidota bacterium]